MPDGRHILIIDEDAFLAGIYARRFERAHWKVHVAESLKDANKHMKNHTPDAVILDIETIPDSLPFIQALRDEPKTAGIMVAVLTKLGDREQIKEAYDAGADAYLIKGHFVPQEVQQKIERLVSESQTT